MNVWFGSDAACCRGRWIFDLACCYAGCNGWVRPKAVIREWTIMGCVLKVYGEHLDIDAVLSSVNLIAVATWKKGQEQILKGRFHCDSGANFVASDADIEDFPRVLAEAELFLARNYDDLCMLTSIPEATGAVLDFAVATRPGLVTQTSNFSSAFLQQLADLDLALAVSHYPTDDISE